MSNPKQHKEQLGKGIRSLLQGIDTNMKTPAGQLKPSVVESATTSTRIAVADIEPNPKQPRRDFDETALQELADSIRQHDIIQPITVAKLSTGKYRLISGERRWRAAKLAGLLDIPAYQRQANDQQLLELALLENLQREDLNAVEVALSYKRMMDELHYTQEQVAERMGKDRSTVANIIRLLKLPPDIQLAVRKGFLSMGHARALLAIELIDVQLYAFNEIKKKELSVRQTELLIQQLKKQEPAAAKTKKGSASSPLKRIEDKLASHFSTRVRIKQNRDGQGQLIIEYYSSEEFNKLLRQLNAPLD
ncbi:MAG: ParB/RepB/Spo0J family partition protein [Sphingomonadales bacterium]|nr:ParB/RepB/Spo0J family partition protein [Sphingomonadales bacterium]